MCVINFRRIRVDLSSVKCLSTCRCNSHNSLVTSCPPNANPGLVLLPSLNGISDHGSAIITGSLSAGIFSPFLIFPGAKHLRMSFLSSPFPSHVSHCVLNPFTRLIFFRHAVHSHLNYAYLLPISFAPSSHGFVCCRLCTDMPASQSLTSLSLCQNKIGPTGSQAIAQALLKNTCLKMLNLADNQVADNGATHLAQVTNRAR